MNTKSFLKASVAALALALGSTAVLAQAGPGDGQGMQQGAQQRGQGYDGTRPYMHKHMKYDRRGYQDFAMMVPGFGPVPQEIVDSLNLTDTQKDKMAKVKASIEEKMQQRMETRPFVAMAELRAKQLADGKLNPKEIIKEREKYRELMQERRGEFTDEWIEVWDDLNDEQQAKLAEYFKDLGTTARGTRGSGPRNR